MTKLCLKCKRDLPLEAFYLIKRPSGNRYLNSPCKTCRNAGTRERYKKDPKKNNRQAREWRKRNRKKYLAGCRDKDRRLKEEVFGHYGGGCSCCHVKELVFLAIDHIGGRKNSPKDSPRAGNSFWRWLKRNGYPKGFRVLCHNCNWAVAFGRTCPHATV